jgi:hypothetical protein
LKFGVAKKVTQFPSSMPKILRNGTIQALTAFLTPEPHPGADELLAHFYLHGKAHPVAFLLQNF